MKYGLQMFSVRDVTEQDMEGALRQVAEMGYASVEFAGFMGHPAEQIKAWLDQYGLEVSGTHTGMALLTDELLEETIAYHKAIGCKNIIVPYEKFATKADIDAFVDRVKVIEPKLKEAGITLQYHNHDHEFKPNEDGLIAEEELLQRTDILLEVDTYWVYAAGKDPVEFLKEHKDRIQVIHLKDGKGGHTCASLGQGIAPVAEVRKAALELGLDMVVESEGLEPTGMEEVKRCIDFLKAEDEKDGI
ncbi:MAG TPA: sugar phosphate isomerase/epimerase [Candidatus Acutalibacter pullicola]|uniref:Sugar phosphate isomerase/epimerase n=1 Tax=Candidatus Acutalibacter pullicola TaxID=2838417 RepID=A0A9D2SGF9_9FIRM|nr:sugar phosphate isomerase/epimerase [Candidatus Acutalibacter pullicola]